MSRSLMDGSDRLSIGKGRLYSLDTFANTLDRDVANGESGQQPY